MPYVIIEIVGQGFSPALFSKNMPIRYKKRIRLKDFDYKGCYRYFITLCTHNKRPIFDATLKDCPTKNISVGQGFTKHISVGQGFTKHISVGQGFSPALSRHKGLPHKTAKLPSLPLRQGFIKNISVAQGFSPAELATWLIDILKEKSKSFGFKIWAYCFMPDHLHLLIEGNSSDSDMKRFISFYKQYTGFYYKTETGLPLWQINFYEHVLRKEEDTMGVALYIFGNPVRKGLVGDYRQYDILGSFEFDIKQL
ncbi:MAG: hypothetical protein A3G39_09985 [Deltaproteobacteria bacterium RIFCSPLOWO2_12_FULL_43_16]|nr:MAG: hypothetical protein A2Z89_02435 [Deltaproteobacteria bacterium GWA2_43_19]OGQ10521.1 MAG: hypothetical protein A3D30_02135 [Deltaproteobacteria bacterium RIFCSPHIGHO2_02_FULL_43_33]OGQ35834.1 MAG: hypothetical protein A3A85_02680 [Deltaproteobacteria bacterium RIFCSPLOWO2_01_FULL_42_9]OGQ59519.1 MAG: hypothetical protein A3G39_09985 [Deltaproteobacteria bacterium RIFCSPLOWO2_12_FULL_43_16]HBR16571.1 hypothetical protein [Deltaproteobacteria bacterium]